MSLLSVHLTKIILVQCFLVPHAGEHLDEFIEHNLQEEEVQSYRFQTIRESYDSESSEFQEAQMEEADVTLARLSNLNW